MLYRNWVVRVVGNHTSKCTFPVIFHKKSVFFFFVLSGGVTRGSLQKTVWEPQRDTGTTTALADYCSGYTVAHIPFLGCCHLFTTLLALCDGEAIRTVECVCSSNRSIQYHMSITNGECNRKSVCSTLNSNLSIYSISLTIYSILFSIYHLYDLSTIYLLNQLDFLT